MRADDNSSKWTIVQSAKSPKADPLDIQLGLVQQVTLYFGYETFAYFWQDHPDPKTRRVQFLADTAGFDHDGGRRAWAAIVRDLAAPLQARTVSELAALVLKEARIQVDFHKTLGWDGPRKDAKLVDISEQFHAPRM